MIFNSISVHNFGPIKNCEIQFKNGLNIITGSNASGKTQLFGAIAFCIFGPKALKIDDKTQEESYVKLAYEKDKFRQLICYEYANGQFLKTFIDKRDAKIIDREPGIFENFLYKYRPSFICETKGKDILNKQDFDLVTKIVSNNADMSEMWDRIKRKYESQIISAENMKILISSMGEEMLLKLIKMLLSELENESPTVIDDALIYFDESTISFILGLLEILSENRQIILFTSYNIIKEKNIVYSLSYKPHDLSNIAYDYRFSEKILSLKNREKQNKSETIIVRYVLDAQLNDEEFRQVEFKEIRGQNALDSVKNVVDEYVVAFLNDHSSYKGRIIWGITDKERRVVGVKLNYNQRDTLRRILTEKLSKISPSIPPSSYEILLQPIYDTEMKKINDLFIIEVIVEATPSQYLYATQGNEVFIKTDGGKKRLTPMEIQQEILKRKRVNGV